MILLLPLAERFFTAPEPVGATSPGCGSDKREAFVAIDGAGGVVVAALVALHRPVLGRNQRRTGNPVAVRLLSRPLSGFQAPPGGRAVN